MLKSLCRFVVYASDLKKWVINNKNFVKYNEYFYILNDAVVKEKIIKKYSDDSLSKHFRTQKTLNLIQRKYY